MSSDPSPRRALQGYNLIPWENTQNPSFFARYNALNNT